MKSLSLLDLKTLYPEIQIEWSVGGGQIVSGQGLYKMTAEITSHPFSIYLTLRNAYGIIDSHVEDFNFFRSKMFSLFPNPATDVVTLKLTDADGTPVLEKASMPYDIQLWSGMTLLRTYRTAASTFRIPLSDLPAGLYFVRIVKDGQAYTEKLMKK